MSTQQQHHTGAAYSARDIILRYESEEEEFVRELEQMMTSEDRAEEPQHSDPDMDAPPILSVLCSLVDEIGSLRTENRRLKTRLAPAPRAKNVVQRMSAMFEQRGSSIFPRLRRSSGGNPNQSSDSIEVRNGARERLSTPPRSDRKENNSMTISTDVSYGGREGGIPPIVRPEMSDSDIDEQIFNDDEEEHRSRDTTRRRQNDHHSTSACTSPSSASASSSRDPSETMTTSRSSFLDLFGFRRRSTHIPQPTPSSKNVIKKRRRKCSGNDSESSGMYANLEEQAHCGRLPNKPPRPASYYRRDDSEDSDCLRQSRQRKAASFLNVNSSYDNSSENIYRVDRETLLLHEKDNLSAEIEELKMRNQRLVEQLREKSQQQSKLQCHLHKAEMQVNTLSRRCALSEALDRLTMNERMEKSATTAMKKVEERLRVFENQMQNAKLEAANAHQMVMSSNCNERVAHQNCLEKLETLQREHLRVIHSNLLEMGVDEASLKRRLENLPTYEALYAFTHSVVRRLNEARWLAIEKSNEASRAQMDLIATQSSLLVTHAQMERLRIGLSVRGKRQKRPSSFHGHDSFDRNVRQDLNFYLPFKLQGSRVENNRRAAVKRSGGNTASNDRNIEEEFLKLFSFSKVEVPERRREAHRMEHLMREMNGNGRNLNLNLNLNLRRQATVTSGNPNPIRERNSGNNRRPISMVETEERRVRRNEETRRSIKFMKTNSIDHHKLVEAQPVGNNQTVTSYQDIPSGMNSPHHTPIFSRRVIIPTKGNAYDHVAETPNIHAQQNPQVGRVRKLERAFSTESRNTVDSLADREEMWKRDRERERDYADGGERRTSKIQRSQPVSRIKQPTTQLSRFRTMNEGSQQQAAIISSHRPRTLDHTTSTRIASPIHDSSLNMTRIPTPRAAAPQQQEREISRTPHNPPILGEKRSWLERLKGIGK